MKTRSSFAPRGWLIAGALLLAGFGGPVHADSLQDIGKLIRQGQHAQAVEQADRYLAGKPKDAQARFLKGIALTEMNRANEAIAIFQKLTEDYPELPEPYNNLAVIYAQQKQYDKAKTALEMAIRTHPSYATAHENLGDIYARLASQAYDKALQLDSSNASAQNKLAMIRDFMGGSNRPPAKSSAKPAADTKPAAPPAETKPAEPKPVEVAKPEPKPVDSKPTEVAAAPAPATPAAPPAKPAEAVKPAAEPAPKPAPAASGSGDAKAAVTAVVNQWSNAWARKDVKAYLATYAKDFKVPSGLTRAKWEAERRARIDKPGAIDLKLENIAVSVEGDKAVARFRQHYQSGGFKASANKALDLVLRDGKWQIQQERVGG